MDYINNYNVYFVPAIVGDIKEHTLDSQYAKKPLNGEKGIEPNPRFSACEGRNEIEGSSKISCNRRKKVL